MVRKITLALVSLSILTVTYYFFFRPPKRNIILIMLDTTRADHLNVYGYERETSKYLAEFANEAVVYENAIAPAPWTPASIASVLTGLYPSGHAFMPPNERELAEKRSARLNDSVTTVAELLAQNSYKTAGISPNPWITATFGFEQGYEMYDFQSRATADVITAKAIDALDSLASGPDPFFFYIHYLDPHDTYDPPAPYNEQFSKPLVSSSYDEGTQALINLYDGEIAFLDFNLGRLFESFKQKGIFDSSLIIVVGDHGEQFKERGNQGHGFKLFNEETRVPLIVKGPNIKPERISTVVSTIDIYPTIAEFAKIPIDRSLRAISLFDSQKLGQRTGVLSEIKRKFNQRSFVSLDFNKLILNYTDTKDGQIPAVLGLYNFKNDPYEQSAIQDASLENRLRADFDQLMLDISQAKTEAQQISIDDSTLDQLRSMGYLN